MERANTGNVDAHRHPVVTGISDLELEGSLCARDAARGEAGALISPLLPQVLVMENLAVGRSRFAHQRGNVEAGDDQPRDVVAAHVAVGKTGTHFLGATSSSRQLRQIRRQRWGSMFLVKRSGCRSLHESQRTSQRRRSERSYSSAIPKPGRLGTPTLLMKWTRRHRGGARHRECDPQPAGRTRREQDVGVHRLHIGDALGAAQVPGVRLRTCIQARIADAAVGSAIAEDGLRKASGSVRAAEKSAWWR